MRCLMECAVVGIACFTLGFVAACLCVAAKDYSGS